MVFAIYHMIGRYSEIGWLCMIGLLIFISMLLYQHSLVKFNDLSRVNMAFFTTNGIASVVFGLFVIVDFYLN
jgi:4-hydroxybenzoate polyprenyltransferase